LVGKVKGILEGEGAANLAERYANNLTDPDETARVEGSSNYYTNPQTVYDKELGANVRVEANKLIQMWEKAIEKRSANHPNASLPTVGPSGTKDSIKYSAEPSSKADKGTVDAPKPKQEITFQTLIKDIQDAGNDLTGRAAATKLFANKFYEILSGELLFKDVEEAKTNLNMINTAATASLVGAVPGRESEQFRLELKAILPEVGKFTVGNETSLLQFRAAEAFFNNEIESLEAKRDAPKPVASVGEIDRALTSLGSFRDAYSLMRRKLEAESRMKTSGGQRKPIGQYMR